MGTIRLPLAAPSSAATAACRVTLAAIRDPFDADAPTEYGTRLVGVHVIAAARADGLACGWPAVALVLEDGDTITGRLWAPACPPAAGDGTAGWLLFAIYADARPAGIAIAFPSGPDVPDDE